MDESMLEKLGEFKRAMTESLERSVARHPEYDADKLRGQMQPLFDAAEQVSAEGTAAIERGKEEVRSPWAGKMVIDNEEIWKPFRPPKPKGAKSIDEFVTTHHPTDANVQPSVDRLLGIQRAAPPPEASRPLSDWVFESAVVSEASIAAAPDDQSAMIEEESRSGAPGSLGDGYCRFAVSSKAPEERTAQARDARHGSFESWIAASGIGAPAVPMPELPIGTDSVVPARAVPAHRGFESWLAASAAEVAPTSSRGPDAAPSGSNEPAFGTFTRWIAASGAEEQLPTTQRTSADSRRRFEEWQRKVMDE